MSRKSSRPNRNMVRDKSPPSILRRKRKAESDLEELEPSPKNLNMGESSMPEDLMSEVRVLKINKNNDRKSQSLMRPSPLPEVNWGDSKKIWENMIETELEHPKDCNLFMRHPELQPRMRSILLDWLIEVAEVYKLHRETFYIAQDFIDRYLASQNDLQRERLQLIGITSLFIASKMEEIYPPKISEFAYVTDGACTEAEIIQQEVIMLMSLQWYTSPITISTWLSTFLQVAAYKENNYDNFEIQSFSGSAFKQICQVLDLCVLDVNCLKFSYGVLAASAIALLVSKDVGLAVSNFQWTDLEECVRWMTPFVETVWEHGGAEPKFFSDSSCDESNIQTHDIGLKFLEIVQFKQQSQSSKGTSNGAVAAGILTPPQSGKKLGFKKD